MRNAHPGAPLPNSLSCSSYSSLNERDGASTQCNEPDVLKIIVSEGIMSFYFLIWPFSFCRFDIPCLQREERGYPLWSTEYLIQFNGATCKTCLILFTNSQKWTFSFLFSSPCHSRVVSLSCVVLSYVLLYVLFYLVLCCCVVFALLLLVARLCCVVCCLILSRVFFPCLSSSFNSIPSSSQLRKGRRPKPRNQDQDIFCTLYFIL